MCKKSVISEFSIHFSSNHTPHYCIFVYRNPGAKLHTYKVSRKGASINMIERMIHDGGLLKISYIDLTPSPVFVVNPIR